MAVTSLQTGALSQLCSKDQLDILNCIDQLRSEGIDQYVSLPQIIVCGDQSAGKSSVLEAISGISFPVQSNTCTRFPTELILRRTPQVSSSVSIVPDSSRTEAEKLILSGFRKDLEGSDGLGKLIDDAKAAMGIHAHGKTFSKDLLRIEKTGPEQLHLTIVDLPGLIHSATKSQTDDDVGLIRDVVKKYMEEPRSVILAIFSAKNDLENQIVLKMARKADPAGQRTMGIITKPDSLVSGSRNEKRFADLAQNKEVEFRHGWHVLKNLDSETSSFNLEKRNQEEENFFSKNVWQDAPAHLLGVSNLKPRLSSVLTKQIASELPSLIEEIKSKRRFSRKELEKMGQRRATKDEQYQYLVTVSMNFQSLIKASIDGTYNNPFFADPQSESGYCQRLRAVIQNCNQQFARELVIHGQYRDIIEPHIEYARGEGSVLGGSTQISRGEFITHIRDLMYHTRGRELPGTFSPMIVEDLFREQCRPWEGILNDHVDTVSGAARKLLNLVCGHIADDTTGQHIMREIVEPALESITKTLQSKAYELLEPHKNGHPITYNHYFTETLQKVRDERRMDEVRSVLADWLDIDENALDTRDCKLHGTFNMRGLMKALSSRSEPDMDRFAASEALDCMEAYYKVALKRFMDDVAIELVEAKLVQTLPDIFSPMTVCNMSNDTVDRIAGESEGRLLRREQLEERLDRLGNALDHCKRFMSVNHIDVVIDGARLPVSASARESTSDGEAMASNEPLSDGAPASDVCTDLGVSQPDRSPERIASPDFVENWTARPDFPRFRTSRSPKPYTFRG